MQKKNIIYLIISFLIVFSFSFNIGFKVDYFTKLSPIIYIISYLGIYKLLSSREDNKINIFYLIMGLLISITTIFAFYIDHYQTITLAFRGIKQLIKTIFMFIGYSYVFYYLIDYLFKGLSKIKYKKSNNKIIKFIFDDHPFVSSFIIILICYIPIMYIFYPGVLMNDGVDVLREYYCIDTNSTRYINLIDPNVCINTHHSAFYAYMSGSIYNIFNNIGNPTLGLFVITFIQVIFQVLVLAYTMKLLKKLNTNYVVRIVILLLFSLLPIFNINSVGIYKDIYFCNLCLLLTDLLIEYLLLRENNLSKIIWIIIVCFLLTLISNKGLYIVGLISIILLIYNFKDMRYKSILFLIPILIYLMYSSILLPSLHVTKGSIREALAMPIQQVSRYVVYYGDEVTEEEKASINGILEYDLIDEKYDPHIADPVKNSIFNKDYTKAELMSFMRVYVKLFFKHPGVYINSFFNMTAGNFDFYKYTGVVYTKTSYWDGEIVQTGQFKNPLLVKYTEKMVLYSRFVPIVGLLYNLALYVWLLIIFSVYLVIKKLWKFIIPLIPSIVVLLFLFVSPVNGNRRYVYPIMYCMMILIPYIINLMENKKLEK